MQFINYSPLTTPSFVSPDNCWIIVVVEEAGFRLRLIILDAVQSGWCIPGDRTVPPLRWAVTVQTALLPPAQGHGMILADKMMPIKFKYQKCKSRLPQW